MAALVAPLLRRAWRRPTRVLLSRSRSGSARRAQHSVAVPAAAAMAAAPAVLRSGEDVAAWLAQLPEGGSPPAAEAAAGATTVRCTGRVTACRRNKAATFCDVELSAATADAGANPAAGDAPPAMVQLVLQRGRLTADEQRFKAFSALTTPGATIAAVGLPACDRPGGLSLYASQLELRACDATAASVTRLVDLAASGVLTRDEVCVALSCDAAALAELTALRQRALAQSTATADAAAAVDRRGGGEGEGAAAATAVEVMEPPRAAKKQRRYEYKQAVLRTSRLLQGLPPEREARQRTPRLSKADASTLNTLETRVRRPPAQPQPQPQPLPGGSGVSDGSPIAARVAAAVASQLQDVQSLRDPGACCCRGPGSRADYLHGKKRPQVEWMLSAICQMVEGDGVGGSTALSAAADAEGGAAAGEGAAGGEGGGEGGGRKRRLQILDVGGGRGDLALCAAAALPACDVTVIDTNAKSIADGEVRASGSGLSNIRFVCGDAAAEACAMPVAPDLIIGLHACGGLTDLILQLATMAAAVCGDTSDGSGVTAQTATDAADADADAAGSRCGSSSAFPSFLVVPCCFNKHPQLVSPDCDWTTAATAPDGPVQLSAEEVATLQRLAESSERGTSHRAMMIINSLRLEAVRLARQRACESQRQPHGERGQQGQGDGGGGGEGVAGDGGLQLREFSEEFSLRNLVLCGGPGYY